MHCPSCGARVSDQASSCAICGQAMVLEAAAAGRTYRLAPPPRIAPERGTLRCPTCAGQLDVGATFCSDCGTAVRTGEYELPPLPEPDPDPEPELVVDAFERAPEESAEPPEVVTYDAVVVPGRFDDEGDESDDRPPTGPVAVAPEVSAREDGWAWVPPAAGAFALFALLTAMLVHLFAPSTMPDFSPSELSLKTDMRAIEWLLAGAVIALVGLLAKR